MDEMVARLNIEHFLALLRQGIDDSKRSMVAQLLSEEESKLAVIQHQGVKRAN